MKKNKSEYSTEFKMSVLKKLQSGEIKTVEEARRMYSVGGKSTIARWKKQLNSNILNKKKIEKGACIETENRRLLMALGQSFIKIIELQNKIKEEHGQQIL